MAVPLPSPWIWRQSAVPRPLEEASLPPNVLAQMRSVEMAGLSQQLSAASTELAARLDRRINCVWNEAEATAICEAAPPEAAQGSFETWLALILRARSLGMVRLPLEWARGSGPGVSIRLPAVEEAAPQQDIASPKALASSG